MTWIKGAAVLVMLSLIVILAPYKAEAQGATYYTEESKDGRIYVFYYVDRYGAWKSGGEMGVAITRIGYGPNGETVVFDSNEAINVYNAKHGLPVEVFAPEKKPTMKVGWKDGKTTIETDNAALIISNRVQFRMTGTETFPASPIPTIDSGDTVWSFRMRRVKTKFEGWFYDKDLTYELQLNWADTANALEDANLNFDFTNGKKNFMIKGGQFKIPFGRQELTSSGNQEFVDRSIASSRYARGREPGIQIWGTPMEGKLDWRVGVSNGDGRNSIVNDDGRFSYDVRVTWQPWGDVKYSEGDFESTDKPLFAIAGQFEANEEAGPQVTSGTTVTPAFDRSLDTYGFDVVFKYKGLFVFLEDFERNVQNEISGSETDERGYNLQAGYFIVRNKFEVAGRYAEIDPNKDIDGDNQKEYGVAAGWFYNKHNLKLQGDYRRIETEKPGSSTQEVDEFRLQLQFIF